MLQLDYLSRAVCLLKLATIPVPVSVLEISVIDFGGKIHGSLPVTVERSHKRVSRERSNCLNGTEIIDHCRLFQRSPLDERSQFKKLRPYGPITSLIVNNICNQSKVKSRDHVSHAIHRTIP
jgi:hypothetical protein